MTFGAPKKDPGGVFKDPGGGFLKTPGGFLKTPGGFKRPRGGFKDPGGVFKDFFPPLKKPLLKALLKTSKTLWGKLFFPQKAPVASLRQPARILKAISPEAFGIRTPRWVPEGSRAKNFRAGFPVF